MARRRPSALRKPLLCLALLIPATLWGAACAPAAEPSTEADPGEEAPGEVEAPDQQGPAPAVPDLPPDLPPVGPPWEGIDVSHYSGDVDWIAVRREGYDFAYVKATEGVDALDPRFAEHWQRLAEVGLYRGAYHFFIPRDDPEEQARFFLDTVDHTAGDLLPVVDVESRTQATEELEVANLRRFLELIEADLGVRPMIYTSARFWDDRVEADLSDHPLWIVDVESEEEPRLPAAWERWHLWQWRFGARVPGVTKDADLNRLHPEVSGPELLQIQVLESPDGEVKVLEIEERPLPPEDRGRSGPPRNPLD